MGEQKPNPDYGEILRLEKMLTDADIPHEMERFEDGWQIFYPGISNRVCIVNEHRISSGSREDRLALSGLLNKEERKFDIIVGYLTAENVADRIRRDWERRNKRAGHQKVELSEKGV